METNKTSGLRIGIPIIGNKDWLGGVHYVKSIVEAVNILPRDERPRVYLVIYDQTLQWSDLHRDFFGLLDGIIFFGQNIRHAKAVLPSRVLHCQTREEFDNALDFFYPVVADVVPDLCSASWIYDFQHVYLPEFFPREEILSRNTKFRRVAETAKLVVLSSKNAEQDFRRIFPESKAVTRVLSFHSLLSEACLTLDPSETQRKYSLPDKFLICCNQFWIHKNHRLLFGAMAEVVRSAPDTHLICTGSTGDWRFQDYFSQLTAFIEQRGLQNHIRILGQIPRADQIQLMRRSLAVIQPSLFEGWSSVVEESRMLGKTIILSDFPVHREQAPDHAIYFDRHSAGELAGKILDALPLLTAGPDYTGEHEAREKSVKLADKFGRDFCRIAEEAQYLFHKKMRPESAGQRIAAASPTPQCAAAGTAERSQPCEVNRGVTIVAPANYTNKSWYEEAKRLLGDDADITILSPPLGEGFEEILFRENILFLGASHHLPGLFDNDDKIHFWNALPSKKYFYQYEKVIGSFLPDSEQRERNVHKIKSEVYAVQDEYDAAEYEKVFGKKAVWLPDMISAERIRRGQHYPPVSARPIDILFVGKIQAPWYQQRQAVLQRLNAFGAAHNLKTVIMDTSYMRFNDVDIIEKNYYSQAKVVINPIGTGNFFNIRFFETLAAGCICLQQVDNNGFTLKAFRDRYKDYNAVYFTTSDLEQKLSSIFSDIRIFENKAVHTRALLSERDTGEARFRALGISSERSGSHPLQPDSTFAKENLIRLSSNEKGYPKISIVTPSFNQGQFLEECIDSILSQNYPNLEYVIMDGGSSDNSIEIIKKYEKHLTYWQSKPDGGQYPAINEGFKHTTGEIMTWLNSDDLLHPKSLDIVAGVFSRVHDAEWIMGRPNGIDQHGRQTWILDVLPLWAREKYLKRQYKYPYVQQEGTFWRRGLWEKAGAYMDTTCKLAADMELWARFFRFAQLHSVDALLGAFRSHPQQKTAALLEQYNQEAEEIIDREIELYSLGVNKTLLPAPPPITIEQLPEIDQTAIGINSTNLDRKPGVMVSAIVSTFNSERFMRGCLEDLVGQTLYQKGGLEIVVVDSGSEQKERTIVAEFQAAHGNIQYIRTGERESVYAAWNRGIKAASGEYLTTANTDDRHRKDALEIMGNLLDSNPAIGLVYADVIVTETENETFEKHTPVGNFRWQDFDRTKLAVGCFIGPQPVWRKSLHDKYGYFDETFSSSGDWEFWLRIAEGTNFLHIRDFLGLYLRSSGSLEHRNSPQMAKEDRLVYKRYMPKYVPAYEKYLERLLGSDPSHGRNIYRYGQILAALDQYDKAIGLYSSYLQKNPDDKLFSFALEDLKNLKALHAPVQTQSPAPLSEKIMAYINQADAHIASNDLASARDAIEEALRHTEGHVQLTGLLSNILSNLSAGEKHE